MSVLESYSYFIGSRASLPSGQGILVITKRKKSLKKARPGGSGKYLIKSQKCRSAIKTILQETLAPADPLLNTIFFTHKKSNLKAFAFTIVNKLKTNNDKKAIK